MSRGVGQQTGLLISQKVKPGLESQFRAWQGEMATAASQFSGFQGLQIFPPVPGLQEDWVILLRFADPQELQVWLQADIHASLIAKGQGLFASPGTHIVMAAPQASNNAPIVCIISSRVGHEQVHKFRLWQQNMEEQQSSFAGYLGTETFPPVAGVTDDWTILFRFDSDEHLEAWLQSEERKQLISSSEAEFQSFDLKKVHSSFGGWFPAATESTPLPPSWAQSMVVVMALYPVVMLIGKATAPFMTGRLPFPVIIFLNNVLGTIALTWPAMPLVNKAMHWWLYPSKDAPSWYPVMGILLVLLYYALVVSFFVFALK